MAIGRPETGVAVKKAAPLSTPRSGLGKAENRSCDFHRRTARAVPVPC